MEAVGNQYILKIVRRGELYVSIRSRTTATRLTVGELATVGKGETLPKRRDAFALENLRGGRSNTQPRDLHARLDGFLQL
jgi:hypothetical protein